MNQTMHAKIPVTEGMTYRAECQGIGEKGDGIFKIQGYVIVVPKAIEGEEYIIRVTAVRGKVSFGEIIQRIR